MRAEDPVLLVEDDASIRRSLGKFLNRAGYAFDSCRRAEEVLSRKIYLKRRAEYLTKISDAPLNSSDPVLRRMNNESQLIEPRSGLGGKRQELL